jgi:hypothetical protein
VLGQFLDRLPEEWRAVLNEDGAVLVELSEKRAVAFYGDDVELVPASDLFGDSDARRALAIVERLVGMYERLLRVP